MHRAWKWEKNITATTDLPTAHLTRCTAMPLSCYRRAEGQQNRASSWTNIKTAAVYKYSKHARADQWTPACMLPGSSLSIHAALSGATHGPAWHNEQLTCPAAAPSWNSHTTTNWMCPSVWHAISHWLNVRQTTRRIKQDLGDLLIIRKYHSVSHTYGGSRPNIWPPVVLLERWNQRSHWPELVNVV